MRAAIYLAPGKPLRIEQRADPTPGAGELVIQVHRCGICGTDLSMTSGQGPGYPVGCVPGHEFSGEVVALGAGVSGFRVGDRVTSMGFAGCGQCDVCRAGMPLWCPAMRAVDGGFGEYTVSPAQVCVRLPEALSLRDGALVEPMACGLHAAQAAGPLQGQDVLVLGAGAVGLAVLYWVRRLGALSITVAARGDAARERAMTLGADNCVRLDALHPATALFPVIFECTGASGLFSRAIAHVRPRGCVVVAGMCAHPEPFVPALGLMKEARVHFAMGYSLREMEQTADRLARDEAATLAACVGEDISLDALPARFEQLRRASSPGKVLVAAGLSSSGDSP